MKRVQYSIYTSILTLAVLLLLSGTAIARDLDYRGDGEILVRVQPGEPTQVQFPGKVSGGFKKTNSALFMTPKQNDLILFSNEMLAEEGEALIVRLEDGRSYPMRIQRAETDAPRDAQLRVIDKRDRSEYLTDDDEEVAPHDQRKFAKHHPNTVAGFMRELVLASEFGKDKIPGYRVSHQYHGEAVMNDGNLSATVDRIYMGSNFWGYVIDASNHMDVSQQINPATFRLDGTRAVSLTNWELSPKPLNIEQQIAGKHKTKVYVITRPRK